MIKLNSVRAKLLLFLLIPLGVYLWISVLLIRQNESNVDELKSALYETTSQSTSLILNADRDMYQALTAYQLLVSGTLSAEDKAVQSKAYKDNIDQANSRVRQAATILTAKQLLPTSHAQTQLTIEQNLNRFYTNFEQWVKETNQVVAAGTSGKGVIDNNKLMRLFSEGREGMNQIGEVLDNHAQDSIEAIHTRNQKTKWLVYVSLGATTLVILAAGFLIIWKMLASVRRIVNVTEQAAAGDLRHEPQTKYAEDELGQITEAVDTMVLKTKALINVIAHHAQFVHATAFQLSDNSKELAAAAEVVAVNVHELTQDVELQTRSSEETSRAVEEMAIGIQRVAENTSVIAERSSHTSHHAERGNELLDELQRQIFSILASVDQLSATVDNLTRKSDEIGQIASSITNFANQTNLLSLNASIEAARAGEHGRGFNVVASEIRKLATQSLQSAESINQLIGETRLEITSVSDSMNATKQEADAGSTMMHEVKQSFHTILQSVQHIVTQIHETSAITEQMSASSQQITATMEHFSQTSGKILDKSQGVAATVEEQFALMQSQSAASEQLKSVVNTLDDSVALFKTS